MADESSLPSFNRRSFLKGMASAAAMPKLDQLLSLPEIKDGSLREQMKDFRLLGIKLSSANRIDYSTGSSASIFWKAVDGHIEATKAEIALEGFLKTHPGLDAFLKIFIPSIVEDYGLYCAQAHKEQAKTYADFYREGLKRCGLLIFENDGEILADTVNRMLAAPDKFSSAGRLAQSRSMRLNGICIGAHDVAREDGEALDNKSLASFYLRLMRSAAERMLHNIGGAEGKASAEYVMREAANMAEMFYENGMDELEEQQTNKAEKQQETALRPMTIIAEGYGLAAEAAFAKREEKRRTEKGEGREIE